MRGLEGGRICFERVGLNHSGKEGLPPLFLGGAVERGQATFPTCVFSPTSSPIQCNGMTG